MVDEFASRDLRIRGDGRAGKMLVQVLRWGGVSAVLDKEGRAFLESKQDGRFAS
jgi:hypothetical protein